MVCTCWCTDWVLPCAHQLPRVNAPALSEASVLRTVRRTAQCARSASTYQQPLGRHGALKEGQQRGVGRLLDGHLHTSVEEGREWDGTTQLAQQGTQDRFKGTVPHGRNDRRGQGIVGFPQLGVTLWQMDNAESQATDDEVSLSLRAALLSSSEAPSEWPLAL